MKLIPHLVGLSALLLSGEVLAEDRALLIGVSRYQDGSTLPGVDQDPLLMRDVVKKLGFKDSQIKLLQDAQANRAGILSALNGWLVQGVNPQDKVILYYSGHGTQVKDQNGDEPDGCDEALVPYDYPNLIIDDELGAALERIPAKEVMVVLDSCFSGTATKALELPSGSSIPYLRGKVREASPTVVCNQAANVVSSSGADGSRVSLIVPDTFTNVTSRTSKWIELSAAASNEVALTWKGGSMFTLALHKRLVEMNGPVSFADLREFSAKYVRDTLSQANERRFVAHTPQLAGPEAWLNKDVFAFGKLGASTSLPVNDVSSARTGSELLNRYLNTSGFKVEVTSNKGLYKLGDSITYQIVSAADGYLNLFEVDAQGTVTLLFPNRYNQNNYVRAGVISSFPSQEFGKYRIEAGAPYGKSQVVALLSLNPLNLYDAPGNQQNDFRLFVDLSQIQSLIGEIKANLVKPLPTLGSHGAGYVEIEVKP